MGTASATQRTILGKEKVFDARQILRQQSLGLTKARHLSALSGISTKYKQEVQASGDRKLREVSRKMSAFFHPKDVEVDEEGDEFEEFEALRRASRLKEPGFEQFCNKVFMIEPTAFYTNEGCIVDNGFMKRIPLKEDLVQKRALSEWKAYKSSLEKHGIEVVSFKQEREDAPDSVWPDWFTTLKSPEIPDGVYILYPMKSKERSKERQAPVMDYLASRFKHKIDLTHFEQDGFALEGKGTCVFDVRNRKIYCSLSPRCNLEVVNALVSQLNAISGGKKWRAVVFKSQDQNGNRIYHTDCMLTLYSHHAVICLDAIRDRRERQNVMEQLVSPGLNQTPYDIINISLEEINHMVCNGFNLRDQQGYSIITMSARAYEAIDKDKLAELKRHYTLVVPDIQVLEDVGGGSTRCLLAEHF